MTGKTLVTAALLLFVATSVVALAVDLVREQRSPPVASRPAPPAAGTVVYYFHGDTRCPTCRAIESQAHKTLETQFARELARGEVEWRVLNFEAPENAAFANQFQLFTAMLVLVDGRTTPAGRWKTLDEVWALYDNPPAYQEYVAGELRRFMQEGP